MRVRPNYIDTRIEQLKEELDKPNKEYDKIWYHRLIQELQWASDMQKGTMTSTCYMETKS